MANDILTVMWKELKELFILSKPRRVIIRMLLLILFFGVIIPIDIGAKWLDSYVAVYYWVWFSCFIAIGPVANSLIRERTSNSLETLLASRLPDESIYLGKFFSGILYSFSILFLSIIASLITVNLREWNGAIMFFSAHVLYWGIILSLFSMFAIGGLAYVSSLKVKNPLRTIQIINLIIMILIIPGAIFYWMPGARYEKLEYIDRFDAIVGNEVILSGFIVLSISSILILRLLKKRFTRIYLLE